jgi:hypothetical protein
LAHEASLVLSWSQFDQDLATVQSTLQHLGFVSARPQFNLMVERSAAKDSKEPGILAYFDYSVILMEGEKKVAEFNWQEKLHKN